MAKNKKIPAWVWVLLVIFVIVLILIYVGSFGKVNIGNVTPPKEFKDNKEQVERRHKKLKALIEKKEELKQKLTKIFNRTYLAVRFGFILLWGAYIFALIKIHWIENLGDALNYSEVAILGFIAFNFLTFGTLTNLNSFIDLIKLKLENWIWGKYINIDEDIDEDKKELAITKNILDGNV